jgi:hypothetical protein
MAQETTIEEPVPFEWITSFSSLAQYLNPDILFPTASKNYKYKYNQQLQVLHIGCGSSTLGEALFQTFPRYNHVVNVDVDIELMAGMKQRWLRLVKQYMEVHDVTADELPFSGTLSYSYMNFQPKSNNDENISGLDPLPNQKYDLILDKSTLDCLLISDDGAAGVLCTVYKLLKRGGVYFLISFHHVDFIMQLLEQCPGADWNIEKFVVERKGDSLKTVKKNEAMMYEGVKRMFQAENVVELDIEKEQIDNYDDGEDGEDANDNDEMCSKDDTKCESSAWESGSFAPGQDYLKNVNVFICRRNDSQKTDVQDELDFEAVNVHIHAANEDYYKKNNPMVTHVRVEELKTQFQQEIQKLPRRGDEDDNDDTILPLELCYELLFTETEKEHLSYDFFLEDYEAFVQDHQNDYEKSTKQGLTFEGAVKFLEVMQ